MSISQQSYEIAKDLSRLGPQLFFNSPVEVQEQKINKPATEFYGSFIGNQKVIIEIRVYSPTYYIVKVYRKGEAVKTDPLKTKEEVEFYVNSALGN